MRTRFLSQEGQKQKLPAAFLVTHYFIFCFSFPRIVLFIEEHSLPLRPVEFLWIDYTPRWVIEYQWVLSVPSRQWWWSFCSESAMYTELWRQGRLIEPCISTPTPSSTIMELCLRTSSKRRPMSWSHLSFFTLAAFFMESCSTTYLLPDNCISAASTSWTVSTGYQSVATHFQTSMLKYGP